MTNRITRRTVLRGLGTAVAIPMLDAMAPRGIARAATAGEAKKPLRMAFFFVPNGVNVPLWTPTAEGPLTELPYILDPLTPHRERINVLSGLELDAGWAHGDGPGDHARAAGSFLTASHPHKTHGADIQVGVSVDQVAAKHLGDQTPFRSLELGCERGQQAGNCDSGYSCAYSSNISWSTPTTPVAKEIDPRNVFDRLFASGSRGEQLAGQRRRQGYRRSILDLARDDAKRLQGQLGAKDQRKLDEYFTSIREIERRIGGAQREIEPVEGAAQPEGIPKDFGEHIRLMFDMLTLAFQTDLTRISSMMIANAGSNRSYPEAGVSDGHHWLSHHENDAAKLKKIADINRFHIAQFAYLLDKLSSVREGDGTLLDQCMIVYGSALGDGNRHNHNNLPVLLAGNGGGTIETGRHIQLPNKTPLANVYLAMLQRFGVPVTRFGDSTGALAI